MFNLQKRYAKQEEAVVPEQSDSASANVDGGETVETVSIEKFNKILESVQKLEANNALLVQEKRAEEQRKKDAEHAAKEKDLELAQKAGDWESWTANNKAIYEDKLDKEVGKSSAMEKKLITQSLKASHADFLDDFADKSTATLALNSMIKVSLDENLDPIREYRDLNGNLITSDPAVFKDFLNKNHASWMKGPQSEGGLGSAQKPATGSAGSMEMKRDDFSKLPPARQMEFVKSGGKIK